ncbi:hypothetical protein R3P38DRAFT_3228217 [Favolaschia claudopus]|uniref:Uncharacterized protein n=1 Tax=Favolaschia claudopus TaxID=2862362 RepID=A0AAV9ZS36_9AGAR
MSTHLTSDSQPSDTYDRQVAMLMEKQRRDEEAIEQQIRVLERMIQSRIHRASRESLGCSSRKQVHKDIRKWRKKIRELKVTMRAMGVIISYDICCQFERNLRARANGGDGEDGMEVIAYLA